MPRFESLKEYLNQYADLNPDNSIKRMVKKTEIGWLI